MSWEVWNELRSLKWVEKLEWVEKFEMSWEVEMSWKVCLLTETTCQQAACHGKVFTYGYNM